ncbi:MAG: hypothetical protein R3C45_13225 [Phycisphaerales bacterium]
MELMFIEEPDPECLHGARRCRRDRPGPDRARHRRAMYQFDHIVRRKLPMTDSPAGKAIAKPKR